MRFWELTTIIDNIMSRQAFYPHLSVDCVLIGFDEEGLKVLLVEKTQFEPGHTGTISKLPGDLIYEEEELDAAARRVLFDMTGMSSPFGTVPYLRCAIAHQESGGQGMGGGCFRPEDRTPGDGGLHGHAQDFHQAAQTDGKPQDPLGSCR